MFDAVYRAINQVFNQIVTFGFKQLRALIDFLPTIPDMPQGMIDAFDTLDQTINYFVYYFPDYGAVLTMIGIILTVELALQTFYVFSWVWTKIPFT